MTDQLTELRIRAHRGMHLVEARGNPDLPWLRIFRGRYKTRAAAKARLKEHVQDLIWIRKKAVMVSDTMYPPHHQCELAL